MIITLIMGIFGNPINCDLYLSMVKVYEQNSPTDPWRFSGPAAATMTPATKMNVTTNRILILYYILICISYGLLFIENWYY